MREWLCVFIVFKNPMHIRNIEILIATYLLVIPCICAEKTECVITNSKRVLYVNCNKIQSAALLL